MSVEVLVGGDESSIPTKEKTQKTELDSGEKIYHFLEKTKFLEMKDSEENFEEWFQNLSYDEFSEHLTRLNGIIRKIPIKNRRADGTNVNITTQFGFGGELSYVDYLPPESTKKDAYLRSTFETLKGLNDNKERGFLAYYAIQAIHPYNDGNGRTGRLLYEIFTQNKESLNKENLSKLLDHEIQGTNGTGQGRAIFTEKVLDHENFYHYINREVVKELLGEDFLRKYSAITPLQAESYVQEKYDSPQKNHIDNILTEKSAIHLPFNGIVRAKFISANQEFAKYSWETIHHIEKERQDKFLPEDVGKKKYIINSEDLDTEIEEKHFPELIQIHKEVKDKFLEKMIDIFANPNQYKIKMEDGSYKLLKSFCLEPPKTK